MLNAALAHRAIDHARLAEAAAARAAAQHLDVDAVVHDLHERHDDALGIGCRIEIGNHVLDHRARHALLLRLERGQRAVLVVGRLIQAGHVDAAKMRQPAQAFLARYALGLARLHHVDRLQRADLAVADGESIDEVMQRFRIERARTARDDDGILPGAILAVQRDAGQIENLQDVGVAHLVLERDAQHVEAAHGRPCLDGKERHSLLAHQIRHIHPRHEHALAERIVPFVDDIVQDAGAEVRHAHLIHIRKRKRIADRDRCRILEYGVHFAAHVARRLLHAVEQRVDSFA